ncbi:MAG TPA: VTT domain-containing protein [Candidatus Thermoplasmatota archaeon]|nr:VTT domain-containing protein [Candidatus Thermoplasmatota archaeon]
MGSGKRRPLGTRNARADEIPTDGLAPDEVWSMASLDYGLRPAPGLQPARFLWSNVVKSPRPLAARRGDEGAYAVYLGLEADVDLRIQYTTIVRADVDDEGRPRARVEERVSVSRRALLDAMDRVRRGAQEWSARARERLGAALAWQRAGAKRAPRWLLPLLLASLRLEARVGVAGIELVRAAAVALVEIPDLFVTNLLRLEAHLYDRLGRRSLWQGVRDPSVLTLEQRAVVAFLTFAILAATVLVLNSIFALALPAYADAYRGLLANFLLHLTGTLGAPIFMEPLVALATVTMGPTLAFAGFFLGKAMAVWILYLLGESLHDWFLRRAKGRTRGAMDWLHRHADRHGVLALVAINAVPFAPEQLVLVLAVSGMRFRSWMAGNLIGSAIKIGGVVLLTLAIGPERVGDLFSLG